MDEIGTVKRREDIIVYHDNKTGKYHFGIDEASEDIEGSLANIVDGEEYVLALIPKREFLARYDDGK